MTDERQGEALLPAVAALPRGSGVVFRHKATPAKERRALFEAVRKVARARRLVLVLAGSERQARAWRADGAHRLFLGTGRGTSRRRCAAWLPPSTTGSAAGPLPRERGGTRTAPAHNRRELVAAVRAGVDLVFLSPLFPTRSHPGPHALGRMRFAALATRSPVPLIALGGVERGHARLTRRLGAHGWAAIDGLTPGQKRKAVPR